jgi:hypothetical protein
MTHPFTTAAAAWPKPPHHSRFTKGLASFCKMAITKHITINDRISFHAPARSRRSDAQVLAELLDVLASWIAGLG